MMKASLSIMASIFIFTQSSAFAATSANFSVAEKHFLEGKYDTAISESETLISSGSGKKDELYYLKGLSELKVNRFGDARASFNQIISNYPWSKKVFDARLGMGDSYFLGGDNARALSVYNDMISQYPSDRNIATVYSRLSSCYARMGARAKADSYYAMVKTKAPLSFEAKSASAASPYPQNITNRSASSSGAEALKFSVQAGSFKNKRNADALAKKLARRGYESYVEIPVLSSEKLYRVKVGKFTSRDKASALASTLESDGYRVKICTDDACE